MLIIALPSAALAEDVRAPKLGTPITNGDAAKWDLNVFPDGRGLPPGRGTAVEGRALFDKHCASCHGEKGRGATAEELVGASLPPSKDNPAKTIGAYWPFATTLFDFTRRSMPPSAPGSLTADQLYAVTAYLLFANGVIGENDEMTADTLAKIKMPNRDGFTWVDVKP